MLGGKDWVLGSDFWVLLLGGLRSQNLELRSKKESAGNTFSAWKKGKESQIRTWTGSFGRGPELRILRLGLKNWDPGTRILKLGSRN